MSQSIFDYSSYNNTSSRNYGFAAHIIKGPNESYHKHLELTENKHFYSLV